MTATNLTLDGGPAFSGYKICILTAVRPLVHNDNTHGGLNNIGPWDEKGFGGVRWPTVEQTEFAFNEERHSDEIYLLIRTSILEGVLF